MLTKHIIIMTLCLFATNSLAAEKRPTKIKSPRNDNASHLAASKPEVALILASDGVPSQEIVDFYRAVYASLASSPSWQPLALGTLRSGLPSDLEKKQLSGIPTISRKDFRAKLPKRLIQKSPNAENRAATQIIPGSEVADLQRIADNLRTRAVIVADCATKKSSMLKGCGLYYYDRVAARVTASSIKTFSSGASDATLWASPMVSTLEEGIARAQREKDQDVIEELIARGEQGEETERYGVIAIFGRGDRAGLTNGWSQSLSGGGLELGFLKENVGALAHYSILRWSGDKDSIKLVQRTSYGLGMIFRAEAIDKLLWFFEISGGKETTKYSGQSSEDTLQTDGLALSLSPGIGLTLGDFLTLNMGVGWKWFFENQTSRRGHLSTAETQDLHGPALTLRAMFLL
jgi:hypothetical protein